MKRCTWCGEPHDGRPHFIWRPAADITRLEAFVVGLAAGAFTAVAVFLASLVFFTEGP